MAEYLIIAETIIFKNDKLTCINIYDSFRTIAMPAEFIFDAAVMCGPNWTKGEHKLTIKAKADNGKTADLGSAAINIPNENFVYNAFINNVKLAMDYSVKSVDFIVSDNGKEILSRRYAVNSMLVPQKAALETKQAADTKIKTEKQKKIKHQAERKGAKTAKSK